MPARGDLRVQVPSPLACAGPELNDAVLELSVESGCSSRPEELARPEPEVFDG